MARLPFLALGLLLVCLPACGEAWSCFSEHVSDAIRLNQARAPRYAALSYGDSRSLSRVMILSERLSLVPAGLLELRARSFQKAGIPILCADFLSMATTPVFQDRFPFKAPHISRFRPLPLGQWAQTLSDALDEGFPAVHETARRLLGEIDGPPGFHCMARHLLESVARVSYLAPQYEEMAAKKRLRHSPAGISRSVIRLHLNVLWLAGRVDRQAAQLQSRGIPIVCQDVPPIAMTPRLPQKP
jgi:hypothetical protein